MNNNPQKTGCHHNNETEPHHCRGEHEHHLHAAAEEEPIVLSYTANVTLSEPLIGTNLAVDYRNAFQSINQWCQAQHALVGHIKLQLRFGDHSCWISSTGEEVNIRKTESWDRQQIHAYALRFTAIVFQTTLPELKTAVTARMPFIRQ